MHVNIPEFGGKDIIFFDGVCNLCNGVVEYIIRRDKRKRFFFASLQSAAGQKLLHAMSYQSAPPDSILLYSKGTVYTESSAALKIFGALGGLYPFSSLFYLVPRFVRDHVYRWIARNRYKWFGRKDECMIPTPELTARFLNS